MCDVSTAVLAAVAIIGAGASYVGAEQTASTQQKYAKAQAEQGSKLAMENFRIQNQAESEKRTQENTAATQQALGVQREYAQARATARASAGEAGVAGLSVDALLNEFNQHESEELGTIRQNGAWADQQSKMNRLSIGANAAQNIGRTRYAPIARPSTAVFAAQLAGIGLNTYTSNRRTQ